MKNLIKKISEILIVLTTGFLAGFIALFLSITFEILLGKIIPHSIYWTVIFLVIIEELTKFHLLNFINNLKEILTVFLRGLFLGLGFGLFEFILIALKNNLSVDYSASIFIVFLVHIGTSVLISFGIQKGKEKRILLFFFIFLAIIIHFSYNLGVIH